MLRSIWTAVTSAPLSMLRWRRGREIQAGTATVLPFFQTMRGKPKRRFSARSLRAARRIARSARATNAGGAERFLFFAWLLFLFIRQLTFAQISYHVWPKLRDILRADHGCPKPASGSPAEDNRQ